MERSSSHMHPHKKLLVTKAKEYDMDKSGKDNFETYILKIYRYFQKPVKYNPRDSVTVS